MRCPKGKQKRRVSKPHGSHSHGDSLSPYNHGLKGHTWQGHGIDRECINCHKTPR